MQLCCGCACSFCAHSILCICAHGGSATWAAWAPLTTLLYTSSGCVPWAHIPVFRCIVEPWSVAAASHMLAVTFMCLGFLSPRHIQDVLATPLFTCVSRIPSCALSVQTLTECSTHWGAGSAPCCVPSLLRHADSLWILTVGKLRLQVPSVLCGHVIPYLHVINRGSSRLASCWPALLSAAGSTRSGQH